MGDDRHNTVKNLFLVEIYDESLMKSIYVLNRNLNKKQIFIKVNVDYILSQL